MRTAVPQLRVRVLDRGRNAAIAGVRVEVLGRDLRAGSTDSRGETVFEGLPAIAGLRLRATHPSYHPGELPVTTLGSAEQSVEIRLAGRGVVFGTVRGAGRPLAGAEVSAQGLVAVTGADGSYSLGGLQPSSESTVAFRCRGFDARHVATSITAGTSLSVDLRAAKTLQLVVELRSAARPRGRLSLPAAVKIGASMVHTGYLRFRGGTAIQRVPWRAGQEIEVWLQTPAGGRVRATGAIDHARGRAHVDVEGLGWAELQLTRAGEPLAVAAVSFRSGKFRGRLHCAEPGRVLLPYRAADDDVVETTVFWTAHGVSAPLAIRTLGPGVHDVPVGDFGGRVHLAPVAADTVDDLDLAGSNGESDLPRSYASGRRTLVLLVPPGDYTVRRGGIATKGSWLRVAAGADVRVDLSARLPGSAIEGRVRPGCRVVLQQIVERGVRPITVAGQQVAANARFKFPELVPGDYLVTAKTGPGRFVSRRCSVARDQTKSVGVLDAEGGRVLRIECSTADGTPLRHYDFKWTERPVFEHHKLRLRSDANGRVEVSVRDGQRIALVNTAAAYGISTIAAGAGLLRLVVPREKSRTVHAGRRRHVRLPAEVGLCAQLFLIRKLGDTLWFQLCHQVGKLEFALPAGGGLGLLAHTSRFDSLVLAMTKDGRVRLPDPTPLPIRAPRRGAAVVKARVRTFFGNVLPFSTTTTLARTHPGVGPSLYLPRGCTAELTTKEGDLHVLSQSR